MDVLREANRPKAGRAGRSFPYGGRPTRHARTRHGPRGLRDALDDSALGYTEGLGLPCPAEGIAGLYKRWMTSILNPENDGDRDCRVRPGHSSSAFTALFAAGDALACASRAIRPTDPILKALFC